MIKRRALQSSIIFNLVPEKHGTIGVINALKCMIQKYLREERNDLAFNSRIHHNFRFLRLIEIEDTRELSRCTNLQLFTYELKCVLMINVSRDVEISAETLTLLYVLIIIEFKMSDYLE